MKYRKTFREALNDVEKKDKPEAKPEVADEKPVEDKDAIIKKFIRENLFSFYDTLFKFQNFSFSFSS